MQDETRDAPAMPAQEPPLDDTLLAAFARAGATDDTADAAAFIRATLVRIQAQHRRALWLRLGATLAPVALVVAAVATSGAHVPLLALASEAVPAFARALAMPATWAATVVLLLALRAIAHALPGNAR